MKDFVDLDACEREEVINKIIDIEMESMGFDELFGLCKEYRFKELTNDDDYLHQKYEDFLDDVGIEESEEQ
jgi:hypothetical protein